MNIIPHVICSSGAANAITVRVGQVTEECEAASCENPGDVRTLPRGGHTVPKDTKI